MIRESRFFPRLHQYAEDLAATLKDSGRLARVEVDADSRRLVLLDGFFVLTQIRESGLLLDSAGQWRPRRALSLAALPQVACREMPAALFEDYVGRRLYADLGFGLDDALDIMTRNDTFEDKFALANCTELFLDQAGLSRAADPVSRALARFLAEADPDLCRWLDSFPRWDCTTYNRLRECRDAFATVAAEAPHLLPTVAAYLLAHQHTAAPLPLGRTTLQTVKTWLAGQIVEAGSGLRFGNGGWRRLCRLNAAQVRELMQAELTTALYLIRTLEEMPPLPLLHAWAHAQRTRELPPVFLRCAAAEALRRWRQGDFSTFLDECALAEDWARQDRIRLARSRGPLDWATVQQRQQAWHARVLQARNANLLHWESLLPQERIGNFESVPLVTGHMLWEEGQLMRHCVGTYERRCLDGEVRVFSLRDNGRRIATVELVSMGELGWRIGQVRGFANAPAGDAAYQLAERIRHRYDEIWRLRGRVPPTGRKAAGAG